MTALETSADHLPATYPCVLDTTTGRVLAVICQSRSPESTVADPDSDRMHPHRTRRDTPGAPRTTHWPPTQPPYPSSPRRNRAKPATWRPTRRANTAPFELTAPRFA